MYLFGMRHQWLRVTHYSNVYLEKDERQALRIRKHYMLIFFWIILLVFS